MTREELEISHGYWQAKWEIDLYFALNIYLDLIDEPIPIRIKKLAKKAKVKIKTINQILDGDIKCSVNDIIKIVLAIGKKPHLKFV